MTNAADLALEVVDPEVRLRLEAIMRSQSPASMIRALRRLLAAERDLAVGGDAAASLALAVESARGGISRCWIRPAAWAPEVMGDFMRKAEVPHSRPPGVIRGVCYDSVSDTGVLGQEVSREPTPRR